MADTVFQTPARSHIGFLYMVARNSNIKEGEASVQTRTPRHNKRMTALRMTARRMGAA